MERTDREKEYSVNATYYDCSVCDTENGQETQHVDAS